MTWRTIDYVFPELLYNPGIWAHQIDEFVPRGLQMSYMTFFHYGTLRTIRAISRDGSVLHQLVIDPSDPPAEISAEGVYSIQLDYLGEGTLTHKQVKVRLLWMENEQPSPIPRTSFYGPSSIR